ncbi:MAG TPA: purine-binding chemotaxis protein CheW [Firmicutes bacterium]|nr:purine-binding chemotaxis protein CheW [Bacillota bacterium]
MAGGAGEEVQLVVFSLGREEYAVPVGQVQEIIRLPDIAHVPQAARSLEGVINLRGRVIPIVDLKKLFELEATAKDEKSRIVVVEVDGQTVGLTVDTVSEVRRLPSSAIDPPPPLAGAGSGCLTGVGKLGQRLLLLLDVARLVPQLALGDVDLSTSA